MRRAPRRRARGIHAASTLRTATALDRTDLLRIAVSGRSPAGLPYAAELVAAGALVALARAPSGIRPAARLTAGDLIPLWEPGQTAHARGSASFGQGAT